MQNADLCMKWMSSASKLCMIIPSKKLCMIGKVDVITKKNPSI
jgi:hypothetical protein